MEAEDKPKRQKRVYACIFALCLLYFVSMYSAINYERYGTVAELSLSSLALSLLLTAAYSAIAWLLVKYLPERERVKLFPIGDKVRKPVFWVMFLLIMLAWLPYYLACFPGLYVYDAATQVHYALGLCEVNSFHPLIHTYWLSGMMLLGQKVFSGYAVGYALYTLSQMVVMSLCFAYVVAQIALISGKRWVAVVSLLFVGLFPVFPVMAISATKDSAFAALFAVFCVQVAKASFQPSLFYKSNRNLAILVASGLLAGLFRNNALYVVLLVLLAMMMFHRPDARAIKRWFASCLALLIVLGVAVPKAISQTGSNSGELLGIPIQQVARTANYESGNLSDEDERQIEELVPSWNLYNARIADPVKFSSGTSQIVSMQTADFLRLWAKLGMQHPIEYMDAFVSQTDGFWFPLFHYSGSQATKPYLEFDAWILIDPGLLGRDMGDAGYDAYTVEDDDSWILMQSAGSLSSLPAAIRSMCYDPFWEHSVILRWILSPANVLWLALLLFALLLGKRGVKQRIVAVLPVVLYIATCLLGPCYLIRYAFPIICLIPVVVAMLLSLFLKTDYR